MIAALLLLQGMAPASQRGFRRVKRYSGKYHHSFFNLVNLRRRILRFHSLGREHSFGIYTVDQLALHVAPVIETFYFGDEPLSSIFEFQKDIGTLRVGGYFFDCLLISAYISPHGTHW